MTLKSISISAVALLAIAVFLKHILKAALEVPHSLQETTRTVGTLSIVLRSIEVYLSNSLEYSDQEYCKFILELPYKDPEITITDSKDNSKKRYTVSSNRPLTRITLNGGMTDPVSNSITTNVLFRDFSAGCNRNDYHGNLTITQDGTIDSIKFPGDLAEGTVVLSDTDNNTSEPIFLLSPDSKVWLTDFNADNQSEYLVLVPEDTSLTAAYMIDSSSNTFSSWFNDGVPVKTDKKIEDIEKDFSSQREFVLSHTNVKQ